MKIFTAHLPTYLPGIELFFKMAHADAVILADHLQYSKHGVTNRSRVKTPEGARWLTVPVLTKGRGRRAIHEIEINNSEKWALSHWRALQTNYNRSPYFMPYVDHFERIYHSEWRRLIELNVACIRAICACLKLNTPIHLSSEFEIAPGNKRWLADVIKRMGGTAYLVTPAQRARTNFESEFTAAGIRLLDVLPPVPRYHQLYGEFVPDLSLVDLLFNEGGEYFSQLTRQSEPRAAAK